MHVEAMQLMHLADSWVELVHKCNADMSCTLKQPKAMKLELAKSQADRTCLLSQTKNWQKKCLDLQQEKKGCSGRHRKIEVQMH